MLLILVYNSFDIIFGTDGFVSFGNGRVFACAIRDMYVYILELFKTDFRKIDYFQGT